MLLWFSRKVVNVAFLFPLLGHLFMVIALKKISSYINYKHFANLKGAIYENGLPKDTKASEKMVLEALFQTMQFIIAK